MNHRYRLMQYMAVFLTARDIDERIDYFEFCGGDNIAGYADEEFVRPPSWKTKFVESYRTNNEYFAAGNRGGWLIDFQDSIKEVTGDEYDDTFTVRRTEMFQWIEDNPTAVDEYNKAVEVSKELLAEIATNAKNSLELGLKVARRAGLPFIVDVDGASLEVLKIAHVDWNASSMYC